MKTYFRMIILFLSLLLTKGADAQDSHWQCDVYAYEYDMAVYYAVAENGVAVTDFGNYEVAAFVGDECRGVGEVVTSEIMGGQTVTFGYLRVRSNSPSGETVTFKCYDKAMAVEYHIEAVSIPFTDNGVEGLPSTPLVLSFTNRVPGDVNGDNLVDSGDVMAVYQVMAGNASADMQTWADVNGDNSVDSGDIMAIYRIMADN